MAGPRVTERRLSVGPGTDVAAVLVEPEDAIAMMVLGHGAGTPMQSPVMAEMAEALAVERIATFRYNYPYSERMEADYSPATIDPLDVLLATARTARDVAKALSPDLPLFLGGRSMSSQVMSLAMADERWPDVRGVVLYVFPMRWRVVMEDTVSHLQRVQAPMLFVQGDRDDDNTDLRELRPVLDRLGDRASLHVVAGADHGYNLPVESGRTRLDALSEVASVTAAWVRGQLAKA